MIWHGPEALATWRRPLTLAAARGPRADDAPAESGNDFYTFNVTSRTWASLMGGANGVSGSPPSARAYCGLGTFNGSLYLFGGTSMTGLRRPLAPTVP